MFLVHRVPYPPNRGDRIRSYHILKSLAEVANVSLATLADEPVEDGTRRVLDSMASRVAIESVGKTRWLRGALSLAAGKSATEGLFFSPRLKQTVREWSRETRWDAVIVFCSSMMQYTEVPELAGASVIVDLVDVDSQKFYDYAAQGRGLKSRLYQLEAGRLRRLEKSLPERARAIVLVSSLEAELYRQFCPNGRTLAISNGVDCDYFRPANPGQTPWRELRTEDRSDLVFVGALDYLPNIEGACWFAREVWPLLAARRPGTTLSLVGRNPVAEVRELRTVTGIRVFGDVPDVRPYLSAAHVAVAPLQIARGIQNKVLEAMAMGKPIVASPPALEGLEWDGQKRPVAATSPNQWVEAILTLLADCNACASEGREWRQLVESRYTWERQLEKLTDILSSLSADSTADSRDILRSAARFERQNQSVVELEC